MARDMWRARSVRGRADTAAGYFPAPTNVKTVADQASRSVERATGQGTYSTD